VTGWLLDTNILSELRRPRPDPKVVAFVASKPLDLLFVSVVTLAEIRFGIERLADAGRRADLNDWLAQKVRPMFEQRVLVVSEDIMFKWRVLVDDGRKVGHTYSQPDLIDPPRRQSGRGGLPKQRLARPVGEHAVRFQIFRTNSPSIGG
jgi:toxin FitB